MFLDKLKQMVSRDKGPGIPKDGDDSILFATDGDPARKAEPDPDMFDESVEQEDPEDA